MKLNQNYFKLEDSYLFSTIAQKVARYKEKHPGQKVISLGIGDVTCPLAAPVVGAMEKAVHEMGEMATFRGYGEEQGYGFLRKAIATYYEGKHVTLHEREIFISDGAKSDLGNILDLFDVDNTVLVPDPVYPVYVDTNIMAGRKLIFMQGNQDNGFLPMPDESVPCDIIYLCSPNNPTGAVYNHAQLKAWVDYANAQEAIILFDAAYEAFISDEDLPTSIYQIEGATKCAIEVCSLSKTAGFTGTRCGYTIVPKDLTREGASIHKFWLRRQTTKFNGVSYIIQRGAQAVFTDVGLASTKEAVTYYKDNASIIANTLEQLGIWFCGGKNSPYIWLKCPGGMTSWDYFDFLLGDLQIVSTPGAGFGKNGEGFLRLTAFGDRSDIEQAMQRIMDRA